MPDKATKQTGAQGVQQLSQKVDQLSAQLADLMTSLGTQQTTQAARQATQGTGQERLAATETRMEDIGGGERLTATGADSFEGWTSNRKAQFDDFREQHQRINEALDSEINSTKSYLEDLRSRRLTSLDEQQKYLSSLSNDYLEHRKQLHNQHTFHANVMADAIVDPGPGEESLKK